MLVDDEPDIRLVAVLTLESIGGFEVVQAASGAEALDLLSNERVDVVLLDVMMPGMDGPTMLASLRERGDTTPVIFLTAKVQESERARFREVGALGVITKPFDPMELSGQVERILAAGT